MTPALICEGLHLCVDRHSFTVEQTNDSELLNVTRSSRIGSTDSAGITACTSVMPDWMIQKFYSMCQTVLSQLRATAAIGIGG